MEEEDTVALRIALMKQFRDARNILKNSKERWSTEANNINRNNLRINRKITNNKSIKQKWEENQLYGYFSDGLRKL